MNDLKSLYEQEELKVQLEVQEQAALFISEEIYNNIGQVLSLVRLNISTIEPIHCQSTQKKISISKLLLDQAIEDLRVVSRGLNIEYVSQQSLLDTLRFQTDLLNKARLSHIRLQVHGQETSLDGRKKLFLFRIIQETIMNTIHFSRAESIGINVVFSPNQVLLEVRSHGVKPRWTQESDENLDEQEISIRRMSYRAHLIGAHFNIVHTSKKATVIHLLLPLTL